MTVKSLFIGLGVLAMAAVAQEPKVADPATAGEAVAVRTGSLTWTVETSGRLIPREAEELSLWLEAYSGTLLVLDVVDHGAPVNAGDRLITLDLEPIDRQIEEAELDLLSTQAEHRRVESESRMKDEAAGESLEKAKHELEWARRRHEGWLAHEVAARKERDRLSRQSTDHRIDDQRDELAQLERMYREDELVDAVEEIVVKRQRRSLAQTTAFAKLGDADREYRQRVADAIEAESRRLAWDQKQTAHARVLAAEELAAERRAQALKASRRALEKKTVQLARLRADRDRMELRASRNGIVLHGDRKATPGTGILSRGSALAQRKAFMTIAEPESLECITRIPESKILAVKSGLVAELRPEAAPELVLQSRLSVAWLPSGTSGEENVYDATLPLEKWDVRLRPGMRCKVSARVHTASDALIVPLAAIDAGKVRSARKKSGPFEERVVTLGPRNEESVVVVSGVAIGEYVLVGEAK